MSITSHQIQRRPLSPIARVRLAEQAHEAAKVGREDPHRMLIARVRAAHLGLAQIHATVDREYERQNSLVPPPAGLVGHIHPSRRVALEAFMKAQGWSDRSADPVAEMPTREELAGTMIAVAKAQIAETEAALAAFEEERRKAALGH